jgi:hypothetical protein
VSTIVGIAAKTLKVPWIRSEIGHAGVDHAARPFHQFGQALLAAGLARTFDDKTKTLLDQIFEPAPA